MQVWQHSEQQERDFSTTSVCVKRNIKKRYIYFFKIKEQGRPTMPLSWRPGSPIQQVIANRYLNA
jgi:hypothetical protein